MSEPKMKTTVYAKKLKKRLFELKAERVKALKKFEVDVAAWRKAMLAWVRDTAVVKVNQIKTVEIKDKYRRSDTPGFNTVKYFEGSPQPPIYPNDKLIRDIQRKIQYLAIIHLTEVYVGEDEVGRFFSGADADDD